MAIDCASCGRSSTTAGAVFCTFCGGKLSDPHATISHVQIETAETIPDGPPPERVGSYRILKHLGEGGMGSVYEAEADETGKRVAVKLLSKKLASNPISVERFRQEGRLASQISHPRCVFVYHADADSGRPYIVMELMPGQTLKDIVEEKGRLSPQNAVSRILDVIDGLIEAHRLGLIHRDVKPSNCFVTSDDRVKVGDFGLSKSLIGTDGDANLTGTGAFLGTVLYAPPEQIRGEEVSYDSDVYSVCATLYYLLTARAPYQHESMTAALAKAISEPPPSIRGLRPDVPKALDRLVRKGLDRERSRRFASLEDLRDALQQLLPEEQIPARTRMLLAAYTIDAALALFLVSLPIELLEWMLGKKHLIGVDIVVDPVTWMGFILYFAACEGFAGATIGKWLLGLRVVPHGSVGLPGFGLATLRATVFHIGWLLIYLGFIVMTEVPVVGVPLGVLLVLGGIAFLAYRIRSSTANRGVHDLVTGCHVVQLPRRPHRLRLVSQGPNRLDQGAILTDVPAVIGGYSVRSRLVKLRDSSQVWLADDRSLGRRVMLLLKPVKDGTPLPPTRHNRLRLLGSGEINWNEHRWIWHAFAAPAGAPLGDMIPKERALDWPDTRLLLEQIVEELLAAESDGTLPGDLSINHIWCEPGGRLVLLEFPMPSLAKGENAADSLTLIRQAATLMLEGSPRGNGGRIEAPLPPRATEITNRLFDRKNPLADLGELQCALSASHGYEPQVTTKLRLTLLGFSALFLMLPIALLFLSTQFIVFASIIPSVSLGAFTQSILVRAERPEQRALLRQNPEIRDAFMEKNWPETRTQLAALREAQYDDFLNSLQSISRPERYLAVKFRDWVTRIESDGDSTVKFDSNGVDGVVSMARGETPHQSAASWRFLAFALAAETCVFFLIVFIICAFLFRGGLSYFFSGVTLVRRDGRRAGRFTCAVREVVLWLPFLLALLVAAWVQMLWPGHFIYRLISSGFAVCVLVVYIAIGFRSTDQGPHDRLLGTWRVPT